MFFETIFLFISVCLFVCGCYVIFSKNPVQSVLFLVIVFCLAAQILVLLKIDFLAMVLIIVYVGAIAVLFLFVVMMLNIRIVELNGILNRYVPIGMLIGGLIFFEILFSIYYSTVSVENLETIEYVRWASIFNNHSNVVSLGLVLYTFFSPLVIISSLILLLAIIGSIVLTLDQSSNQFFSKRQFISDQVDKPVNDINFWKKF